MMKNIASAALCLTLLFNSAVSPAQPITNKTTNTLSLVFRDVPINELFEMLSRRERVNIVLTRGVTGNVTVNLYDTTLRDAIYTVSEAAGYAVEERGGGYIILDKKDRSSQIAPANLTMRSLTVQYSNPRLVADILNRHTSPGGKITLLEERKTLIIEDTPENTARLEKMLRDIDKQPAQILIEAKILEITLDNSQQFGVDWSHVFSENKRIGTRGLAAQNAPGLFFNLINRNIEIYLNALSSKGRVNTLATPKLLTLEHQEATTNIGDKIGYKVTTTINNISTESIQFLETGVILRVTPAVDADGRIALKIRPEVSSGTISAGIPSKKTTEVATQLVAEDGQSILIGGLIKNTDGYRRTGVPVLSDIPAVGGLFSSTENIGLATETIVIITPKIVRSLPFAESQSSIDKIHEVQVSAEARERELNNSIGKLRLEQALSFSDHAHLPIEENRPD